MLGQGCSQQAVTMSMNFVFIRRILWAPISYPLFFIFFSCNFILSQIQFFCFGHESILIWFCLLSLFPPRKSAWPHFKSLNHIRPVSLTFSICICEYSNNVCWFLTLIRASFSLLMQFLNCDFTNVTISLKHTRFPRWEILEVFSLLQC